MTEQHAIDAKKVEAYDMMIRLGQATTNIQQLRESFDKLNAEIAELEAHRGDS